MSYGMAWRCSAWFGAALRGRDNTIAGHKYRLDQAHRMITTVRVPFTNKGNAARDVRAFLAVKTGGEEGAPGEYIYEPVETVLANPVLTELVQRDMRREWQALKTKYDHFEEFRKMVASDMAVAAVA